MTVLRAVDRTWAGLLWVMMALAALYVGFIMLAIVYVTIFRSAGWDYNQFVFTLIEYGFLYILFLGSPWLVRTRGHVYIELLTAAVRSGAGRRCRAGSPRSAPRSAWSGSGTRGASFWSIWRTRSPSTSCATTAACACGRSPSSIPWASSSWRSSSCASSSAGRPCTAARPASPTNGSSSRKPGAALTETR